MRNQLRISLFGKPTFHLEGTPDPNITSRKAIAMLVYLVATQKEHSREQLAEMFWEGRSQTQSMANLRVLLTRLRQSVGTYLNITRDSVAFNLDSDYWLDVNEMESHLASASDLESQAGEFSPAAAEETSAGLSYHQADFLEGFYIRSSPAFEAWIREERQRLRNLYLGGLRKLVTYFSKREEYQQGIHRAREWLRIDPLSESAHRQLMSLYALNGQRSAALQLFESCQRVLGDELGVEPSAATQALHEQIKSGEIGPPESLVDSTELPQRTVRGYQLGDLIGRGGHGIVYNAQQTQIRRKVAIKIIHPQFANQTEFIRRFESEARRVARLEHLHIVPLYDYWREPSNAYLVMRLMRGGNLSKRLRNGPMEMDDVYNLIIQITDALAAAHQRGVIHGNLKPTNILFGESGNAYLSDFGITRNQPENNKNPETKIGYDPDYLAPEQFQGELLTTQTDVYSLGIILFEVLTGVHPFHQTPPAEISTKHLGEKLPPVYELRPDLPPEFDQIIQYATAKSPVKRYQNVLEIAENIRELLGSLPTKTIIPTRLDEITQREIYNPYKGLKTFQEADAEEFFGREQAVEKITERMIEGQHANRFLALVGPSGCGKSSLVRAGVIPALRKGALPGSEKWFIVDMIPGDRPLEALEAALLRIAVTPPPNLLNQLKEDIHGLKRVLKRLIPTPQMDLGRSQANFLLFIDQFDEMFTQITDESTRVHFLESLMEAIADPEGQLWVIITLRADFYDRPLQYGEFGDLLRTRTEVVLPLNNEELLQAIRGPAARVGVSFEPGMAIAIASDVADQPGSLPLLQYALTELFERRENLTLTQDAYDDIGGVQGALIKRAEETFSTLDKERQAAVRQLFLRLITLGEDYEDTRRRVNRDELTSLRLDPQVMEDVIESFGHARLLTFDRDPQTRNPTVEVAHEALLREWPRLQEWLDTYRTYVHMQRVLGNAAAEWQKSGLDSSFLLRGSRLDQFEDLIKNTDLALTESEQAFLDASQEERTRRHEIERTRQERERKLERRALQRLRIIVAVLVGALLLGIGLTTIVLRQNQREQRVIEERLSVVLAANAEGVFNEGQRDLGLALALEANSIADPPRQVQRTLSKLAFAPGTRWALQGYDGKVSALDTSPNGHYLLFGHGALLDDEGEPDFALRLWEIHTGQEVRLFEGHLAPVTMARFSPDGKTIISGGEDSSLFWWETETGKVKATYPLPIRVGGIINLNFHPDGKTVIVQNGSGGESDIQLIHLEVSTGEVLGTYQTTADAVAGVAFSPDGKQIFELSCVTDGDCSVVVWDTVSAELIDSYTSAELTELEPIRMALDPEENRAIVGGKWGNVGLIDIHTGGMIHLLKAPNISQPTEAVDINPDGLTALAGFFDGRLCLFEIATGEEMYCLKGHTDHIWSAAFTHDGTQAVSTSTDGTIRLWDLTSGNEVLRFAPDDVQGFWGITLNTDGSTAYSGAGAPFFDLPEPGGDVEGFDYVPPVENNDIIIWDTDSGEEIRRLEGHTHSVWSFALHPDERHLLTGARWEGISLWDTRTGDLLHYFPDEGGMTNVAFSKDGREFIYGSWDGTLHRIDFETRTEIRQWEFIYGSGVGAVTYDPEGDKIFAGMWEGELALISTSNGLEVMRFDGHTGPLWQIHLLPDGEEMLTFASDTTARLWNLENGEEIHRFVLDEFGVASALSSDGRLAIISSTDILKNISVLSLWELSSREEIARFNQTGIVWEIIFSPDGKYFYTSDWDGSVRKWLVPPQETSELVEWVSANRYVPELTAEQRAFYLLDTDQ